MGLGLGFCCCRERNRVFCSQIPVFEYPAIDRGLGTGFHFFGLRLLGIDVPNEPESIVLTSSDGGFTFSRPQIAVDEAGDGIEVDLVLSTTQTRFDHVTCFDVPPFGSTCLTFHLPISLTVTDPTNGTIRWNFIENVNQSDPCLGIYGYWSAEVPIDCPYGIVLRNHITSRMYRENAVPIFKLQQQGVVGPGCGVHNDTFTLTRAGPVIADQFDHVPDISTDVIDGWVVTDSFYLVPGFPNMNTIEFGWEEFLLGGGDSGGGGATADDICHPDVLSVNDPLATPNFEGSLFVDPDDDITIFFDLGFPNGIQNKTGYFDTDWSDLNESNRFGNPICDFSNATWTILEE